MDLRSAKPSESSYFGILDENLFMAFTRAKLQGEAKRFAEKQPFFVKFGANLNELNNFTAPFGAVFLYSKSKKAR